MKIKRNVYGSEMEFELTDDELKHAFEEHEHVHDRNSCRSYISSIENYDFIKRFGVCKDYALNRVDKIAYFMRYDLNGRYQTIEQAIKNAINSVAMGD